MTTSSPQYWKRTAERFKGAMVLLKYDSPGLGGKGEARCTLQNVGDEALLVVDERGALRIVKFTSIVGLEQL